MSTVGDVVQNYSDLAGKDGRMATMAVVLAREVFFWRGGQSQNHPRRLEKEDRLHVNTTAICITDDNVLEEMKQMKEEKGAAEEEKELRKIEREKKKEEREKKKQERAKEKERKAKEKERKAKGTKNTEVAEAVGGLNLDEDEDEGDEDEDNVACPSCGLDYKDDDSDRYWICCDGCNHAVVLF